MRKKGAVTIFEIAILAILATVLAMVYYIFAQSTTENIVLRTADAIRNQECSMMLLTIYNKEYKRGTVFDPENEYIELDQFYDLSDYSPKDYISNEIGFTPKQGVGRDVECTSYMFDPVKLYKNQGGFSVVSGE